MIKLFISLVLLAGFLGMVAMIFVYLYQNFVKDYLDRYFDNWNS